MLTAPVVPAAEHRLHHRAAVPPTVRYRRGGETKRSGKREKTSKRLTQRCKTCTVKCASPSLGVAMSCGHGAFAVLLGGKQWKAWSRARTLHSGCIEQSSLSQQTRARLGSAPWSRTSLRVPQKTWCGGDEGGWFSIRWLGPLRAGAEGGGGQPRLWPRRGSPILAWTGGARCRPITTRPEHLKRATVLGQAGRGAVLLSVGMEREVL